MSYIIENEQNLIRDIMKRVGICRTKQLVNCLKKNNKEIKDEDAMNILKALQRNRYLLLSQDGWAMTIGAYMQFADDKFFDKIITASTEFAIPYDIGTKLEKDKCVNTDLVDCLWIMADMMPDSKEFIIGNFPWSICFDTENDDTKESRIFQITKIPKGMGRTRNMLIKSLPAIDSDGLKKCIRRIALVDDENDAWLVPHLGFYFVCVVDEKSPTGYKIIEKRTGDEVWSDYVNNNK